MTRASRRAERQSLGELVGQIDIGRLGRRGHDRAGTTLARVAQIELARGRSMRLDVTGPGIERQRICEGRERQPTELLGRAVGEGADHEAFIIDAHAVRAGRLPNPSG
jgi:hypothetical protein